MPGKGKFSREAGEGVCKSSLDSGTLLRVSVWSERPHQRWKEMGYSTVPLQSLIGCDCRKGWLPWTTFTSPMTDHHGGQRRSQSFR